MLNNVNIQGAMWVWNPESCRLDGRLVHFLERGNWQFLVKLNVHMARSSSSPGQTPVHKERMLTHLSVEGEEVLSSYLFWWIGHTRYGRCTLWYSVLLGAGMRHSAQWQRSWGRRLDIRKGRMEPQESPWKSSSIYPHNQSLPTLLLCALTYTSDLTGGCPPPPLSEKELT